MAEPDFLRFMCRHLVAVAVEYKSLHPDGTLHCHGTTFLSGFVLELHNEWWWVTAGHCLGRELDDHIARAELQIVSTHFVDYFGTEPGSVPAIPFTYEPGQSLIVDNLELGLDVGMFRLNILQRAAFEKNGIQPVTRDNWVSQHVLTFDHYRMLGIPCSLTETAKQLGGSMLIGCRPVMFHINREDPSAVENVPSEALFVGRIHEGAGIQNIEGMSGGPIFGFVRDNDNNWRYHIVAIQSAWRPKQRVIFATSLPLFAERSFQFMKLMPEIVAKFAVVSQD